MNIDNNNYKNIMRLEFDTGSLLNETQQVYFKFFEKILPKSFFGNYSYGFNLINIGSENSENVTNINLFMRISRGTTKELRINCDVINEFSNINSYSSSLLIQTIVREENDKYIINCFMKTRETYIQYKVFPYILNDEEDPFILTKYKYTNEEYQLILSESTQTINWVDSKKCIHGDLRITGNLKVTGEVDGPLNLGSSNLKSKKFIIGPNGITPIINDLEYPTNNINYTTSNGYIVGNNFIPRSNKAYNLGSSEYLWKELYVNVVKSNYYNLTSPNGTTYQLKVTDDGELYAYKV